MAACRANSALAFYSVLGVLEFNMDLVFKAISNRLHQLLLYIYILLFIRCCFRPFGVDISRLLRSKIPSLLVRSVSLMKTARRLMSLSMHVACFSVT